MANLACPAAEWRAAAFFMAPRWQHELVDGWGAAICRAATAAGGMEAVAAAVIEHGEAAALDGLDPNVSPLLTMLPAEAVAVLWVGTSAHKGNRVAQWAEVEMTRKERKADGWLVAGGDPDAGQQVKSSGAAHVVIRPGTAAIAKKAFAGCEGLVSVLIPPSVTRIEGGLYEGAFARCSALASVAIPASVTAISDGAFDGCSSLASVAIPASVTEIGDHAFAGCRSLASVAIPASVTAIGGDAFYGCSALASVAIPASVTVITEIMSRTEY